MLDGEKKVNVEALKKWADSLDASAMPATMDSMTRQILSLQLQVFKETVNSLSQGDDWTITQYSISQGFMDTFYKTANDAIHIGNYYECFVVPADIETKKKLMSGYAGEETVGEVELYSGHKKIGSIGDKSDLIWSVFHHFFVIVDQGYIKQTLSNHNEIMSLQLWNVENQDEESIIAGIRNILLKLSVMKGLNFKVIRPNELWKERGTSHTYGIQVDGKLLEPIPLSYMNYGVTCDNPRIAFLHCYQVLEFFFVRAQNDNLIDKLRSSGALATVPTDDSTLHKILREYANTQREVESLKLVLRKVVDVPKLKQFINGDPSRLTQYTVDTSIDNAILINLSATDKKIVDKLAERIYFFRCSIAHAKGDVGEYLAQPDISENTIQAELPLLIAVAYKSLKVWGH